MILVSAKRNVVWMRLRALSLAAIGVLALGAAGAPPAQAQVNRKVEDLLPPVVLVGPNCDITGYKGEQRQFVPPLLVPDNDPLGVTTPPIPIFDDGDLLDDVVVALQMSHTWVGDLIVTVTYDLECGGPAAPAAVPVSATLVCRPDGSGDPNQTPLPCGNSATAQGCASDLDCNNFYRFSDEGPGILGVGPSCATSATILPSGCYKPGVGGSSLAVFRGMHKGGCWTLHVSDNALLDTGFICSWGVFVRNQHPVPTLQTSWGKVKNHYR